MPRQNIVRVVLWMTGTLLSFSIMAISIRLLAGSLSVFEILTIRCVGALTILFSLLAVNPALRPAAAHEAHSDALLSLGGAFRRAILPGRPR